MEAAYDICAKGELCMKPRNIYDSLPIDLNAEAIDEIIRAPGVRIERIVSKGHTSPDSGWYDQDENE